MNKEETEVKNWISEVLKEEVEDIPLHSLLKDGVLLCNLINKINNTSSKYPNKSKSNFVQMENIHYFIQNARNLNVPDSENFQTIDLFEGKNMKQVIHCIYSLSRNLHKNGRADLPLIGPKLIDQVKINFTQKQLDDAKRTVSLQYGCIMDAYKSK